MAFKNYRPDPAGLKEISADTGQVCLEAAQRIAAAANGDDPAGQYVASPANVPAGWNNDIRAGATVAATQYSRRGVERRSLVRASNGVA